MFSPRLISKNTEVIPTNTGFVAALHSPCCRLHQLHFSSRGPTSVISRVLLIPPNVGYESEVCVDESSFAAQRVATLTFARVLVGQSKLCFVPDIHPWLIPRSANIQHGGRPECGAPPMVCFVILNIGERLSVNSRTTSWIFTTYLPSHSLLNIPPASNSHHTAVQVA